MAKVWTSEEESELRELSNTKTWDQIAEHFGVTIDAIRHKARQLSIKKKILNKIDSLRDSKIVSYSERHGIRAASKQLGITIDQVKNARRRMQLRREEIRKKFSDPKYYEKFRKDCYYAAIDGNRPHEADDFVGWAMVKVLEGRRVPIPKYLMADYIAEEIGAKESEHNETRRAMSSALTIKETTENKVEGVNVAAQEPDNRMGTMFALADRLDLTLGQRVAFLLFYWDGRTQMEIGKYLGVSDGRVCQLLRAVEEKLRNDVEAKAMLAD